MSNRIYVRADITFSYDVDLNHPSIREDRNVEEIKESMKRDLEEWVAEEVPEDDDFFENGKTIIHVYVDTEPYI